MPDSINGKVTELTTYYSKTYNETDDKTLSVDHAFGYMDLKWNPVKEWGLEDVAAAVEFGNLSLSKSCHLNYPLLEAGITLYIAAGKELKVPITKFDFLKPSVSSMDVDIDSEASTSKSETSETSEGGTRLDNICLYKSNIKTFNTAKAKSILNQLFNTPNKDLSVKILNTSTIMFYGHPNLENFYEVVQSSEPEPLLSLFCLTRDTTPPNLNDIVKKHGNLWNIRALWEHHFISQQGHVIAPIEMIDIQNECKTLVDYLWLPDSEKEDTQPIFSHTFLIYLEISSKRFSIDDLIKATFSKQQFFKTKAIRYTLKMSIVAPNLPLVSDLPIVFRDENEMSKSYHVKKANLTLLKHLCELCYISSPLLYLRKTSFPIQKPKEVRLLEQDPTLLDSGEIDPDNANAIKQMMEQETRHVIYTKMFNCSARHASIKQYFCLVHKCSWYSFNVHIELPENETLWPDTLLKEDNTVKNLVECWQTLKIKMKPRSPIYVTTPFTFFHYVIGDTIDVFYIAQLSESYNSKELQDFTEKLPNNFYNYLVGIKKENYLPLLHHILKLMETYQKNMK